MPRFTIYVDDQHDASRQMKEFIEKVGLNRADPWNAIGEGFLPVQLVVGHFKEDFPEKLQPLSVPCVHHSAPDGTDQFWEGQHAFSVVNTQLMKMASKLYHNHQQRQKQQSVQPPKPVATKLTGGGLTGKSAVGGTIRFQGQRANLTDDEIKANTERMMRERAQIAANKSQHALPPPQDSRIPKT